MYMPTTNAKKAIQANSSKFDVAVILLPPFASIVVDDIVIVFCIAQTRLEKVDFWTCFASINNNNNVCDSVDFIFVSLI